MSNHRIEGDWIFTDIEWARRSSAWKPSQEHFGRMRISRKVPLLPARLVERKWQAGFPPIGGILKAEPQRKEFPTQNLTFAVLLAPTFFVGGDFA